MTSYAEKMRRCRQLVAADGGMARVRSSGALIAVSTGCEHIAAHATSRIRIWASMEQRLPTVDGQRALPSPVAIPSL